MAPTLEKQPKYYEMDGALRAYANRTLVLAWVFGLVALIAILVVMFVRLQPPTVIRVAPDGQATIIGPKASGIANVPVELKSVQVEQAPTEFEKEDYVRRFVTLYYNYDPHTLPEQWANALNMMTVNSRQVALQEFKKNDTVGTREDALERSSIAIKEIDQDPVDILSYNVYATVTIHKTDERRNETVTQFVENIIVHLALTQRSSEFPSGLLVSSMEEKIISTTGLTQAISLAASNNQPN